MLPELKKAATALEKGRTNEALDTLLATWREKRTPELAEAIDALAHAFPAPDLTEKNDDWITLARRGDAGDVFALVSSLIVAGPVSALGSRVEMLAERPADPRIAMAFANFALEPPTTSSSNFYIWTKLFASLETTADARVVPILQKRKRMKPGASKFWPKLTAWIDKALKKIPDSPELTKEEAAAVKAIVAAAKKAKPAKAAAAAPKSKVKAPAGNPLERALAAVKDNDLNACVEALLDGWRERRFAQYAAAIDRVTALHDEGIPHPGGNDAALHKAWMAQAAKRRAIDVGRLADSSGDGKVGDADKRLEEMLTWPEDPRIGRAMYHFCRSNFFSDRARTYGAVAELLVRNADVRFASSLEHFADARGDNKARRAAMRRAGPAALKMLAAVPKEPTSAELAGFDELNKALDAWDAKRTISERRHLEAILAAPSDNGPRLVYADWLTEKGHPRGELIVLQCSDAPDEERIKELLKENARTFFGPAAYIVYSNLAYSIGKGLFERGLLKKIEVRYDTPTWVFDGHPHLWFLEEIEPSLYAEAVSMALIEGSRSLRSLAANPELAKRLSALSKPLSVRDLKLGYALEAERPLATLLEGLTGNGLSNVESLEFFWSNGAVHHEGIPDALAASPLFGKLTSLSVAGQNLNTVLDVLKKHQRAVATLSFMRRHYLDYRLDVELDKKLTPTSVTLRGLPWRRGEDEITVTDERVPPLVAALQSLKLPAKTKLTLEKGVTLDAKARAAVSKVVAI